LIENALKIAEPIVVAIAKGFNIPGLEFEDLAQIGRIKVWELIDSGKIDPENLEEHLGLIQVSVKNKLIVEYKKSKAQKRAPKNGMVYLDDTIFDEGGQTHHDVIADEAISRAFTTETLEHLKMLAFKTKERKAKQGVIWFLVEMLDIAKADIPKRLNYPLFVKFGLARFLWVFFNNSSFRAINCAYPNEFLPWQMTKTPMGYWTSKAGRRRAIKALSIVLEQSGYESKDYPKLLNEDFFVEFGLGYALRHFFNASPYAYLNAVFPGRYHPWEMAVTPKRFFDSKENVIKAVKWLVEEVLGYDMPNLTKKDVWRLGIAYKNTKDLFSANGLRVLTAHYHSPEALLRMVYPDKFMPWDFPNKTKWLGQKGKELAGEATRWVIEEYCGVSPNSSQITCEFFRENRLWGMLTSRKLGFNSSPKAALRNAYGHTFGR